MFEGDVELQIVDEVKSLDPDAFRKLEGVSDYPFLRQSYLQALEESGSVGGRSGWIPKHLALFVSGRLCAFVPGYIKLHSFGEFVFDQGWAQCSESQLNAPYYPKFVVGIPFTPTTGPRFLFRPELSAEQRGHAAGLLAAAIVELCSQLDFSSAHILFCDTELPRYLESHWTERCGIQYQFHNSRLASFDDFLGTFRSKRRAAIRRERRIIAERGWVLETKTGAQLDQEDAALAYRLYLTTVDKYVWGRRYLNRRFFELLFEAQPETVHFVTARKRGGEVAAGAFNLLGRDALFGRYWGSFVDEPFLHFEVCMYAGIEDTIRRGLTRFEAGAGGEHKQGRGLVPTLTRSLHFLCHPTLAELVSDFCAREASAIRASLEAEKNADPSHE